MRVSIAVTAAVCLTSVLTHAAPQDSRTLDLTGAWTLAIEMPVGPSTSTVTLRQNGNVLAGDYSSPALGDHLVEGSVANSAIVLSFRFKRNAQATEETHVTLTGTVTNANELAGTIKLTPGAAGRFTASRRTPGDVTAATTVPDWHDPSPHRTSLVTVDRDVTLEVLDWGGTGRPIVLLPGLGNTAHVYDEFAPRLTSVGHIYGVTLRGFGRSSAPRDGYDAHRMADDVLAVVEALKLERPVLAGHSMSGEELSSFGARYPLRSAGLIYLDSAADRSAPEPADLVAAQIAMPQATAADRQSITAFSAYEKRALGVVMPESELRQTSVIGADGRVGRFRTPAWVFEAMQAGVRPPDYARIRVPALSIQAVPHATVAEGRAAGAFTRGQWPDVPGVSEAQVNALFAAVRARLAAEAQRFQREVKSARNVVLLGAHHYVFFSHPDEVLREMRAFVESLR